MAGQRAKLKVGARDEHVEVCPPLGFLQPIRLPFLGRLLHARSDLQGAETSCRRCTCLRRSAACSGSSGSCAADFLMLCSTDRGTLPAESIRLLQAMSGATCIWPRAIDERYCIIAMWYTGGFCDCIISALRCILNTLIQTYLVTLDEWPSRLTRASYAGEQDLGMYDTATTRRACEPSVVRPPEPHAYMVRKHDANRKYHPEASEHDYSTFVLTVLSHAAGSRALHDKRHH